MKLTYLTACLAAAALNATAAVITFESVVLGSPAGPAGVWKGDGGAPDVSIDGATFFNNNITVPYSYWSGFAFSNHTDTTTAGYGNEFSAWPGSGAGGSEKYAVGYHSTYDVTSTQINLGVPTNLAGLGMSVANTTLTALAVRDGLFGATAFSAGDWLLLRVTGFNGATETGTFDFYLADYRDGKSDILGDWALVDLSGLGTVDRITFAMDGSDSGMFGLNTPSYFAMDNFLTAVPEPSTVLLSIGSLALLAIRRRG